MTVFITGGCKNAKSSIARDICLKLANGGPLYYVATMRPFDDEDIARIKRHVAQREGMGFTTIEQPDGILGILDRADLENATIMLDSVTALVNNELYSAMDAMSEDTYDMTTDYTAAERVAGELAQLCRKVKNIVFVSDYIYMDKDDYNKYTVEYLEALSHVDRALARCCDTVCEIYFGNIEIYKGRLPE